MLIKLKKVLFSRWARMFLSALLIYFAFRKADLPQLWSNLASVSWQLVTVLVLLNIISMLIGGLRWAILVLGGANLKDILIFTKASFTGSFYSLFFPSSVGGDLLKWTTLLKNYPQISKLKLAGTALIDRVIGFSAFSLMAMISLILGKILKYQFPGILFWLFLGINIALIIFYLFVFRLNFEKMAGKYKFLNKLLEIVDLLKNSNKKRIILCFLISMLAQPFWMMISWYLFNSLGIDLKLIQVFIFMPIISLILTLPISWAGFGARENLYLYFLVPLGYSAEKLLFASTFSGVMGILMALLGGLMLLI
ncbi:MAG TPA: lysylphosphatidylglycerol synthase transmembrane domain-containing protein [Candidatus Woesebacteria bacterium]|nr:lysylphosphatidylglycerol synthase transmembrane domain-containing protein [Candidatus Woesebacteria bacterium]